MIETIGYISMALAVAGVIFNNRKMAVCFKIWIVSNSLSLILHIAMGVWSLAIRDFIFLLLAIEGFFKWKKKFITTENVK
jgi:nicotinamide riboside transporter PnuC